MCACWVEERSFELQFAYPSILTHVAENRTDLRNWKNRSKE